MGVKTIVRQIRQGEKLQIEEPVKIGSSEKEADIAIKNDNHRVFLYVETKKEYNR